MTTKILRIIITLAALCCIWCGKNPTENTLTNGTRYEGAGLADRRGKNSSDTSNAQSDTSGNTQSPVDTSTAAIDTGATKELDLSRLGSSYFPLHVGDTWTYYVEESPPSIKSITDTVTINDKTYFYKSNQLFREEKGVIYKYENGEEYVYLDFNKPVGEKYNHPKFTITNYIESKTDTITWHGYKLKDCITIISENKLLITKSAYVKGLGLLYSLTHRAPNSIVGGVIGGAYVLEKATINGIEIK